MKKIIALLVLTGPLYCEETIPREAVAIEAPKELESTIAAEAPQKNEAPAPVNTISPSPAAEFILALDQKKAAIVEEIVTIMGTSSTLGLGFKKNHLRSLGKQLEGVGPLEFLGYVFSRADLKKHMVSIHGSSLKWGGFMEGIKPGLIREAASDKLFQKLPGFAASLKADHEFLRKAAEAKDWEGFVSYLVKN